MSPRDMEIYVLCRKINRLIKRYKDQGGQPNVWNRSLLEQIKVNKEHVQFLRDMATYTGSRP